MTTTRTHPVAKALASLRRFVAQARAVKLGLAALAVLALAAASCGRAGSEPSIAEAVERTKATGSFRVELDYNQYESTMAEDISTDCYGAVDLVRAAARLSCSDFSEFEDDWVDEREILIEEGVVYGARSNEWAPDAILDLVSSGTKATFECDEDVLPVDCDPPTEFLSASVACAAEWPPCVGETTGRASVWLSDRGLVRHVYLTRTSVEGDYESGASASMTLSDFGLQVGIEPPPADQVKGG